MHGDDGHLPLGSPFLCVTGLSVWELAPSTGSGRYAPRLLAAHNGFLVGWDLGDRPPSIQPVLYCSPFPLACTSHCGQVQATNPCEATKDGVCQKSHCNCPLAVSQLKAQTEREAVGKPWDSAAFHLNGTSFLQVCRI